MYHQRQPHDPIVKLFRNDTLGSGSYGVVCKAMWGQCLCAAKLLHPIFFQSNDPGIVTTRRRFEQECRFLNDMKHPHIVEYLGTSHDPDSGLLVLLMELMDESLTHFLERSQQPLAYHIEVDLCHDIAQALAYIHSKDIIHRDLSGNNVLLLAGRAKITDFGMSKLLDASRRMTPLTMCPGNSVYMPPEALREPPVYSKKIDCFSFGVLQIQIMTRQFPHPGPPKRLVEDSRSPTGKMEMPVLDSERRKSHIDLIDPTHTLLPTALGCLSYLEKDRPSAQDLCRLLSVFKEAPLYIQSMQLVQLRVRHEEQAQQIQRLRPQLQRLQQELQTKNQQLQDSQAHMHTLQQEIQTKDQQLQDSQRQIQQLTYQVEDKQHMIDNKETLLQEQNQRLRSNEQVITEFQRNVLQHKQANKQLQITVDQLRLDLQQTMEQQQACERRVREVNQDLLNMSPQVGVQPHRTNTPPRLELQQPGPLLQTTFMQQKAMQEMRWQKKSKAPQKMDRGSAASDFNLAYFNSSNSTKVHSYDFNTQEWHQLPDTPFKYFTLVVVRHIITTVGGKLRQGEATDSLLCLMGEGRDKKWLPNLPPMPTAQYFTAVVCSGHSLIVAGGKDGRNRLATVEVLDTDTRQWSIASSLAHPFSSATISICGEKFYMLGGRDQTDDWGTYSVLSCPIPDLLQSCRPQPLAGKLQTSPTNRSTIWQHVADSLYYYSSCATLCGQLVAVGGWKASKDTRAITLYNERTDSWEAMGDMPTARCQALVAILNGKMMVVGGWVVEGWTETDVVELLC